MELAIGIFIGLAIAGIIVVAVIVWIAIVLSGIFFGNR